MRCPKCDYISFDDQQSCGQCGSDLLEMAGRPAGTVFAGPAPAFLTGALAEEEARDQDNPAEVTGEKP